MRKMGLGRLPMSIVKHSYCLFSRVYIYIYIYLYAICLTNPDRQSLWGTGTPLTTTQAVLRRNTANKCLKKRIADLNGRVASPPTTPLPVCLFVFLPTYAHCPESAEPAQPGRNSWTVRINAGMVPAPHLASLRRSEAVESCGPVSELLPL